MTRERLCVSCYLEFTSFRVEDNTCLLCLAKKDLVDFDLEPDLESDYLDDYSEDYLFGDDW